MMKWFDHKNIVKLLGVCTRGEPVYAVMEFMLHGMLIVCVCCWQFNSLFLVLRSIYIHRSHLANGVFYSVNSGRATLWRAR